MPIMASFFTVAMFAAIDLEHIPTRLGFSLLGGALAYFSVYADPPTGLRETANRIGCGFVLCFAFAPFIAEYFGVKSTNGLIAVIGATGLAAWYFAGAVTRMLKWGRDSRAIEGVIRGRVGLPPLPGEEKK